MGDTEFKASPSQFGSDKVAETASSGEGFGSLEQVNAFIMDGALPLLAGLIVVVFLVYQFARWYLSGRTIVYRSAGAEMASAEPVGPVADEVDDVDEAPSLRINRPWHSRS